MIFRRSIFNEKGEDFNTFGYIISSETWDEISQYLAAFLKVQNKQAKEIEYLPQTQSH